MKKSIARSSVHDPWLGIAVKRRIGHLFTDMLQVWLVQVGAGTQIWPLFLCWSSSVMPFWDLCKCHIPEQHYSSKDTFLLLFTLTLCRNNVHLHLQIYFMASKRLSAVELLLLFWRERLSVVVYIVLLLLCFMLIMSLVCRVVRAGALCSACRSVSTCLSLYFKVAELSGGPTSQISPQDSATVLISKLFLCVPPFVIVFVACLY